MRHFYVVIDKKNKTTQLTEAKSCDATTEKYCTGKLGHGDFRLWFIGPIENFSQTPKKYSKFRQIPGLL